MGATLQKVYRILFVKCNNVNTLTDLHSASFKEGGAKAPLGPTKSNTGGDTRTS